jgi:ABC-type nitrate/sulfonate/bicarbonate transport system substrate-binding protein
MQTRREVIKAVGAGAGAALLGLPAIRRAGAATEKLNFFTPFGFSPDFIEILNAKSGGYFEREGLDVNIRGAQGAVQTMQQLVSGEADFVRNSPIDQMRLMSRQDTKLVFVAMLYQSSNFFMISPKDKPINRAEDLKGKTIGIISNGGTTDTFLDLMLTKVGLPKDSVKRQVTGNSPAALQFVKQGRIDAFIATYAVIIPLEKAGEKITYWSTDRYAPIPNQGYVTTRGFIDERPETVMRFLRAIRGSVEEILNKPLKPIFERAARDFDIPGIRDLDTLVAITDTWHQLVLSQGKENFLRNVPDLWHKGAEELRAAHILDVKNVDSLYTNDFIDRVLKS